MSTTSQYGAGLNDDSTNATHLHLRAFLDVAEAMSTTCGMLFIDVCTTFATMRRCLALPMNALDKVLCARVRSVSVPADEADQIACEIVHYA